MPPAAPPLSRRQSWAAALRRRVWRGEWAWRRCGLGGAACLRDTFVVTRAAVLQLGLGGARLGLLGGERLLESRLGLLELGAPLGLLARGALCLRARLGVGELLLHQLLRLLLRLAQALRQPLALLLVLGGGGVKRVLDGPELAPEHGLGERVGRRHVVLRVRRRRRRAEQGAERRILREAAARVGGQLGA